ncbi:inosine-uridine preferring nucleoside hydrolase-like [Atheta coriaria]|uniref:inosine-uridine preferring nucleoside hydrolase-like n=1 Tax=Dalotia coriaria TaxID=877792 RepID=UPI0031F41448
MLFLVICAILPLLSHGLPTVDCNERQIRWKTNEKLIIDVDPGIDDIEAMVMLLNEHNKRVFQIVAFVISEGNTAQQYGIKNTFRLLQVANSLNIPVYAGSRMPILPHKEKLENFFGIDGFGDLHWPNLPDGRIQRMLAPQAIKELTVRYPDQITYIVLGPMTNLALAMRMYDGLAAKLRSVHAMGGLYRDAAGEVGEFNIMFDPESAEIVFDQLRSPMTIFTWQACIKNAPLRNWFDTAPINNPVFNMMLQAETSLKAMHPQDPQWISCDPMSIVAFLEHRSIVESYESPVTVQLNSGSGRGVITNYTNSENPGFERFPVKVITELDMDIMQQVFLRSFDQICKTKRCVYI